MDTNAQNAIETGQLRKGLAVLNTLAQEEYHKDLDSILTDQIREQYDRLLRVGRLLGVILKEPFASSVPIVDPEDPTQSSTGAYHGWALLDKGAFDAPEKQATWQYEVLETLRKEQGIPTVYDFAVWLQRERGFFTYLAASTCNYISRDPALKQKIGAEAKAGQQDGGAIQLISMGTTSTLIATTLTQHVPWLSAVAHDPTGVGVLSGFVLLIMIIGIGAFCQWTADLQKSDGKKEI